MIDPPLRRSSSELLSERSAIYVVGSGLATLEVTLQGRGYDVSNVQIEGIVSRIADTQPAAVIVDFETDVAREVLFQLADSSRGSGTEIIFIARSGEAEMDPSLGTLASKVFPRPIDVEAIVARLCAVEFRRQGGTVPPPSPTSAVPETVGLVDPVDAEPLLADGDAVAPAPLLTYPPGGPPSAAPSSTPDWHSSIPQPLGANALNNGAFAGPTSISSELEKLLAAAEERVFAEQGAPSDVPSPEAEVNAILPPEVLAALDEPLEASEGADLSDGSESQTPVGREMSAQRTSENHGQQNRPRTDVAESVVPAEPVTASEGGELAATSTVVPQPRPAPQPDHFSRRSCAATVRNQKLSAALTRPEPVHSAANEPPQTNCVPPTRSEHDLPCYELASPTVVHPPMGARLSSRVRMPGGKPADIPASPAVQSSSEDVSPSPHNVATPSEELSKSPAIEHDRSLPEVLTPEHDGLRILGSCIASRLSATLCFEQNGALCRAVMRDGDFVTCGSTADDESLLAFLMLRGDMPRETGMQMVGRIAPFGRHAAAALIANGFLGQDLLWPVLRAHAEWLLGRMATTQLGICTVEPDPAGRLRAEPSVFGGATGAEVLVEVSKRVLPFENAIARLGGANARLGLGDNEALLSECALSPPVRECVERAAGKSIQEVLDEVGECEIASVLVALQEIGIVDPIAAVAPRADVGACGVPDPLDAEAVRKRVDARLALIQEGDYFEVLGVPRAATAYEIRRAYVEARRAFEPSLLLTAETADLADDVRLIVEVLDEAYELLRDESRRNRYLRALEAVPPIN